MGLIQIKTVEGNSVLGIWEMDMHIETLANHLPNQTASGTNLSLKRKKEIVATKLLMDAMLPGVEISYHQSGKPYLENNDWQISISHSKNLVCILLNNVNSVGIDIQFAAPKIKRLKEKFLSDKELATLNEGNETDALHIYWCAKEALYKFYGEENIEFKSQLHINTFSFSQSGELKGSIFNGGNTINVMLAYEKMEEYYLVYTIE